MKGKRCKVGDARWEMRFYSSTCTTMRHLKGQALTECFECLSAPSDLSAPSASSDSSDSNYSNFSNRIRTANNTRIRIGSELTLFESNSDSAKFDSSASNRGANNQGFSSRVYSSKAQTDKKSGRVLVEENGGETREKGQDRLTVQDLYGYVFKNILI